MTSAGSAANAERARRKKLQIRNIEGFGEELFQVVGFGFAGEVDQHEFDIAAEFPEDLAAGSAGRSQSVGIGGDGDAAEFSGAFADRLEDGDALGAEGESVGGVFDVAAGVDAAVDVFKRGADQELGEGREGVEADGEGGVD